MNCNEIQSFILYTTRPFIDVVLVNFTVRTDEESAHGKNQEIRIMSLRCRV